VLRVYSVKRYIFIRKLKNHSHISLKRYKIKTTMDDDDDDDMHGERN
jgi:hypothetical protein